LDENVEHVTARHSQCAMLLHPNDNLVKMQITGWRWPITPSRGG
jgi:hypothetical protein